MSFSVFLGIVYALFGLAFLSLPGELALLASVICVFSGILPDIDATGGVPEREAAGLLAAVAPIFIFELFPGLRDDGISRIALVVIGSYLVTRMIVIRGLQKFTVHRGLVHSIPAAIIAFELAYLMFWDLVWSDRLYIAGAAFVGFFSHLALDGYSNLDLLGKAMGNSQKRPAALKLFGDSWGSTAFLYSIVAVLGWFVARDLNPDLRLVAGIHY